MLYGATGTGVVVAGLSHGAGVAEHEVVLRQFDRFIGNGDDRLHRFGWAETVADDVGSNGEDSGYVGVSHEAHWCGQRCQCFRGGQQVQDIGGLVFDRRVVGAGDSLGGDFAGLHVQQGVEISIGELLASPLDGCPGNRVELGLRVRIR